MTGILLSLLPMIGWGVGDYVSSRLSKKYHPALINLGMSLIGIFLTVVVCVYYEFPEFTFAGLWRFWLVSMFISVAYLSMIKAFSRGATGVVAPVANSYVLLTALLSALLLGKTLSMLGYVAIVVIVLGIALLTYKKDPNHNKEDFQYSVKYSLTALVFFGIGFVLFDVASTQEWYQNNMFFQLVGAANAILIYMLWVRKDRAANIRKIAKEPILYVGSFIATAGTIGLFAAIAKVDNVSIPAAIAAAAPLVTALLAYWFDKEHLTLLQRLSTGVIVGGIILLSV